MTNTVTHEYQQTTTSSATEPVSEPDTQSSELPTEEFDPDFPMQNDYNYNDYD